MASARASEPTQPLGRYRLEQLIARGGMGEVFRAVALGAGGFRKPVVIKRVLPKLGGSSALSEMFVEEARLMSRLVHPNIVQVLDFGRGTDDDYFLVMELVDGVDLHRFCKSWWKRRREVPIATALLIARQVLRGLHHAHTQAYADGQALVHRDVSPGNVLLSTVGDVKVADFGVAFVARPGEDTGGEHIVGKPAYMAPEQYRGDAVDPRADVFSVGVVLYRMLTGEVPFEGGDVAERQQAATVGRWRPLASRRSDAGEHLEAIITQALAPDRSDRFASARAMGGALDALGACGYRMANSDDLAEQVARAKRETAVQLQPVIALGEGGESEGPRAAMVRELSRLEPGGEFTMQLTEQGASELSTIRTPTSSSAGAWDAAPAAPADRSSSHDASPASGDSVVAALPLRGTGPLRLVAALVVSAVLLISWRVWRTRPADPHPAASSATRAVAAEPGLAEVLSAQRLGSPAAPASMSSAPPATVAGPSNRAAASTDHSPHRPVAVSRRTASGAAVPPAASASAASSAVAIDCTGQVLLAAKGSWWVKGGPSRVQAPGQYRWPCGRYTLTASSRVDGRSVTRTVRVTESGTGAVRFE